MKKFNPPQHCEQCPNYYSQGEKQGIKIGFLFGVIFCVIGFFVYTLFV